MLQYYWRESIDQKVVKVKDKRPGSIGVVEQATDDDVARIAVDVGLEKSDLVDIFDAQEIPRLELENGTVLLFIRTPLPLDNKGMLETQLYMLIYHNKYLYVVTSGSAVHFQEVLAGLKTVTTESTEILLEFLLSVSKRYTQYINAIAKKMEQTRTELKGVRTAHIEDLINFEVILNEYIAVLSPMRQLCEALVNHSKMAWREEDKDLLEDLSNSMTQSERVCLVNLKKSSTLRDSYQIIFTNRLNHTLKLLTSVTIILTIPTMLSSLFGMNVSLPLAHHPLAFWLVLVSISIISGLAAYIFKRNNWL